MIYNKDRKEFIAMNILGNSIKTIRKSKKMTQKQLAELTGFKQNTISNHENGNRQLDEADIRKYAEALQVSPQKLFDLYNTSNNQDEIISSTPQKPSDLRLARLTDNYTQLDDKRRDKLVDTSRELVKEMNNDDAVEEELFEYHVYEKLSAGIGTAYFEDRNYDTVYFDEEIDHDLASWVYGDSMEPDYLNGSVALIKGTGFDYDGAIYAVDWDGQSYIKKVYKEKDGLRLVSLNKKYADKFAPYDEEPRIIGKIVGNFMPMEN